MHELGITENIVNITLAKADEAQASKVLKINLVIGELNCTSRRCRLNYAAGIVPLFSAPRTPCGPALNAVVRAWRYPRDGNSILKAWR
jgi:hypothetical protein